MEFIYKCENCGECCKNWNPAKHDKNIVDKNGVCKYLDINTNLCTIYENRPIFCRIDELYKKEFKDKMDWNYYIKLQKIGCDFLRNLGGKNE